MAAALKFEYFYFYLNKRILNNVNNTGAQRLGNKQSEFRMTVLAVCYHGSNRKRRFCFKEKNPTI